ncbi:iron-containing alcohol dehydrogenase, partial [Dubosiella newyorkensis]|uniref:iron-containing alcohol dehydrogenase n=1 Tax=Dubosiella newyorkensis TaxID=1862672 RepID=UPI0025ACAC17
RRHGTKALLIFDSGWIKDTAWYPTVTKSIQDAGVELFELGGVEPNPKTSSVQAAVDICLKEHIDVLLAIGGGSVIDCAKMASTAVFH